MFQLIKPKNIWMPVHGEYKMLQLYKANALETGLIKEETVLSVIMEMPSCQRPTSFFANHRIQTDDIFVDGNDISGLNTSVIKDRKILADNGE